MPSKGTVVDQRAVWMTTSQLPIEFVGGQVQKVEICILKNPQAQIRSLTVKAVPLAEKGLFSHVQCNDRECVLGLEWSSKTTPLIKQLEREVYLWCGNGVGKSGIIAFPTFLPPPALLQILVLSIL